MVQDKKRKVNPGWNEGRTKRRGFRALFALIVFFITLFIAETLMNREETSLTAAFQASTLPVITPLVNGTEVNPLCAYTKELDIRTVRSVILPVAKDRTVRFHADASLSAVQDLRFEVRSADAGFLVENTKVENLTPSTDGGVTGSFVLKDLIDDDTEYMLVILGELDGETIRYYTRFLCPAGEDTRHVADKLDFVQTFHKNTLSKDTASEVATYIESNAEGNNSSFHHVDIHSSFSQITYGGLDIVSHTEPVIRICDLQEQTGEFLLDFLLKFRDEDGRVRECAVQESFQLRYAPERIYLLEYEREMGYLFRADKEDVVQGTLQLSVNSPEPEMAESDGGNSLALCIGNRLYAYNLTENKISLLYAAEEETKRQAAMCQEVHILQLDEAGNVKFLISGYMSRGVHEGQTGVSVCKFDAALNTVEELLYLPSEAAPQILNAGVRRLAYVSQDDLFYFMPGTDLLCVDLNSGATSVICASLREDAWRTSSSGSRVMWQEEPTVLHLMDFSTGEEMEVTAQGTEQIVPVGFMGEDIVYGLLRPADIRTDAVGNPINAMYSIRIMDMAGNILENYEKDGFFITDALSSGNQLHLTRVTYDGVQGIYIPALPDQIMDTLPVEERNNQMTIRNGEQTKANVVLSLKTNVDGASMKLLTPGEVRPGQGRELAAFHPSKDGGTVYYVYDKGNVTQMSENVSDAVAGAYDLFGVVADDRGNVIWGRGNLLMRNQIMAVTSMVEDGEITAQDNAQSLEACLSLILSHAGASRNVALLLAEGNSAQEVLRSALADVRVLDLSGCRLNATLYYINKDLPVLAGLNNGRNVLVVGFNERNVVIADPVDGTVEKMGLNDAAAYFEQNGNRFLTYLPSL